MIDQPHYVYYGSGPAALDKASREAEATGRDVYALIGRSEERSMRVLCHPTGEIVAGDGSIKMERA